MDAKAAQLKSSTAGADAARLPGLDAVRALAIAAVLAYHLNVPGLFNAGFLGVDVFFNLSGFLITSLLLREFFTRGRIDIGRYFWRRFVRLMPAVAVLLLLMAVLVPSLMPTSQRRLLADLPWAGVYLANWWQICSAQSYFENFGNPPLLRHLWSLGVEMQFYLLWPWVVVGLLRLWGVRGVFAVCLLLALASSGWMTALYLQYPDNPSRAYLGADSHSLGLFLGSAMACLWSPLHPSALIKWPLSWPVRATLGSLAMIVLSALMWFSNEAQPLLYQGGFLLTAVASVVLVVTCADWASQHRLPWPWRAGMALVQWLGTRSYSIYLWHWPLFIFLKGDSTPSLWILGQCLIYTAIASEISYRWVEGALTFSTRQWPAFRQRGAGFLVLGLLLLGGVYVVKSFPCQSPAKPAVTAPGTIVATGASTPASEPQSGASAPAALGLTMAEDSDILAIGDSVMLGARTRMLRTLPGITVDAEVGRQPRQSVTLVQRYLDQKPDLKHAVVHLGTNGYILKSDLRRLLTSLQGAQQVVLINNFADRRWSEANNKTLLQVAPEFSNTKVMDWHQIAQGNRHFFVQDGIHLSSEGITAFIRGIANSLGIEPVDLAANRPTLPRLTPAATKAPASSMRPPSSTSTSVAALPEATVPPTLPTNAAQTLQTTPLLPEPQVEGLPHGNIPPAPAPQSAEETP